MDLLETFNKLDRLTETSDYLGQFKEKEDLENKKIELEDELAKWDKTEVEKARVAIRESMTHVLEVMPTYNDLKHTPSLDNNLLELGLDNKKESEYLLRKNILAALTSTQGLTFTISNSSRNLVYRNVKLDSTSNALPHIRDYDAYCLDLYTLIDFTDIDAYTNEAEDPGNLSLSELKTFATSINTTIRNNHWFVPITHPAITFKSIKTVTPLTGKELLNAVDTVKAQILNLNQMLKDSSGAFHWESNINTLEQMKNLATNILNTKNAALTADFGTDLVYKIIFDNISQVNTKEFGDAIRSFNTLLTDYLVKYKDYDISYNSLLTITNKLKAFKIRKPRTDAERTQKKAYDTKQKVDAATIMDTDWYVLGWLAKHTKRLTFTCPAEDKAIWKARLGDENITNKKFKSKTEVDAWNFPELITGSIILDVPVSTNNIVSAYMDRLIDRANTLKGSKEKEIAALTENSKQVNSWKIVRDLVADYNFQLSPFTQKFSAEGDPISTKYTSIPQDVDKIKAAANGDEAALKSFEDGYNA